jgi:hypothetical protein
MATNPTERLESLKQRHRAIEEAGIRAETEVESLTKARAQLVAEMKSEFGVENVDDLRGLARKMHEDDLKALDSYESGITEAEADMNATTAPAA